MLDRLWYNECRIIFQFVVYLLITGKVCAQTISQDDYKIYSLIIRSEIPDSTFSIGLVKNGIRGNEVEEYTQNLTSALKSGNQTRLQHIYSWTESERGERPTQIDTIMHRYILDFCSYPSGLFELSDQLQISCRTFILERNPIKSNNSKTDWDQFYQRYPGSAGIFSFSRVLYYGRNWSTAIVYFWHRRYELNGHGALAILQKLNGKWNIQYKTYLWWN
jgi:hypothetical protein